jgi:hypothetical protein
LLTISEALKTLLGSQAWCCIYVIPALGKLRQEDGEFKVSLGYIVRRYLKKKKNPKTHLAQSSP